jgi:peptidoglycan hydrolase CwlO-like protein
LKVRQLWFVLIVAVIFIFSGFLEARSETDRNERESFKKQIEEKLKEFDKKIEELQQKAVEVKEEARAKYKEEIKDVRGEHKAAKSKLKELTKAGARGWGKVKSEMDAAVHRLENVY